MHDLTRANLLSLLQKHNCSARQLALALRSKPGLEKLQPTTVTRFLNGDTQDVHYGLLKAIADYFETTVDALTGNSPPVFYDAHTATVLRAMQSLNAEERQLIATTALALANPNRRNQ